MSVLLRRYLEAFPAAAVVLQRAPDLRAALSASLEEIDSALAWEEAVREGQVGKFDPQSGQLLSELGSGRRARLDAGSRVERASLSYVGLVEEALSAQPRLVQEWVLFVYPRLFARTAPPSDRTASYFDAVEREVLRIENQDLVDELMSRIDTVRERCVRDRAAALRTLTLQSSRGFAEMARRTDRVRTPAFIELDALPAGVASALLRLREAEASSVEALLEIGNSLDDNFGRLLGKRWQADAAWGVDPNRWWAGYSPSLMNCRTASEIDAALRNAGG